MSYLGQAPGQGQAEYYLFTASGSETSVTAADDGRVVSYTVGQVSVYLNGVKLVEGSGKDFQATNGSTITGLSALTASDVVEVVALSAFSPSDTVSAANGGTFAGNVTHSADLRSGNLKAADGTAAMTIANSTGKVTIAGDLQVSGTTVTIDSATLTVEDKNIEIASVDTPSDTTCEGAGLTIKGGTIQSTYHNSTDKTFTWTDGNQEMSFVSSHKIAENKGSSAWQRPLTTQLGLS